MTRDDRPAESSWRLAIAMVGSVQWELIEPLDDRSIYAEFLAEHGEGLHHVGVGTRDYGETLAVLRAKGQSVLQGGIYNGVAFSYLSTQRDLGVIAEIFDWPEGHEQTPDATYPPA
jgi:methylmalonyl-CoA/ethylmalonyl-CoA epimerase